MAEGASTPVEKGSPANQQHERNNHNISQHSPYDNLSRIAHQLDEYQVRVVLAFALELLRV